MNRKELYQDTVDLLLDAYNEGTLEHGDCSACAAGNICKKASLKTGIPNYLWGKLFITVLNNNNGFKKSKYPTDIPNNINEYSEKDVLNLIKETGYTVKELQKIEWAFETSIGYNYDKKRFRSMREAVHYYQRKETKEGQFIGLCAVLKVLKEIHSAPEKQSFENNNRLKKIYQKKLLTV